MYRTTGRTTAQEEQDRQDKLFLDNTPSYEATEANSQSLLAGLTERKLERTAENMGRVWNEIQRTEYARQSRETYAYMLESLQTDSPLKQIQKNADLIAQWFVDNAKGRSWSREIIREAVEALRPMGVLEFGLPDDPAAEVESDDVMGLKHLKLVAAAPPADQPPWGVEPLTKKTIAQTDAKTIRAWRKEERWAREYDRICSEFTIERKSLDDRRFGNE